MGRTRTMHVVLPYGFSPSLPAMYCMGRLLSQGHALAEIMHELR